MTIPARLLTLLDRFFGRDVEGNCRERGDIVEIDVLELLLSLVVNLVSLVAKWNVVFFAVR